MSESDFQNVHIVYRETQNLSVLFENHYAHIRVSRCADKEPTLVYKCIGFVICRVREYAVCN